MCVALHVAGCADHPEGSAEPTAERTPMLAPAASSAPPVGRVEAQRDTAPSDGADLDGATDGGAEPDGGADSGADAENGSEESTARRPQHGRAPRRGLTSVRVIDCIRSCVREDPVAQFSEREARASCERSCRER